MKKKTGQAAEDAEGQQENEEEEEEKGEEGEREEERDKNGALALTGYRTLSLARPPADVHFYLPN